MAKELQRGERRKRSSPRAGLTWEPIVGGQKIFLRTGEFEDGTLCEIFIDASDQGTFLQAALKGFAIAFSLSLQHGTPLKKLCAAYRNSKFEPCGPVANDVEIKWASSIFDYIAQRLLLTYGDPPTRNLGGVRVAQPTANGEADDKSWDTKPAGYVSKGNGV